MDSLFIQLSDDIYFSILKKIDPYFVVQGHIPVYIYKKN